MGRMNAPQRSENDKIVEYVDRFRANGDDGEAFQYIVTALDGFLRHMSQKKFFFVPGANSDDVYQEGLLALSTKAIPDYRKEKGPFLGFAKLCIRRHIITILKAANNNKNKALNVSLSLDATACHDDEDGPVPISGFIPNNSENVVETFSRLESHAKLKNELIAVLTPLEREVLSAYLQNMSYVEIVKHLNKGRRNKNRADTKRCDNALCRIKKKAMELERENDKWKSKIQRQPRHCKRT